MTDTDSEKTVPDPFGAFTSTWSASMDAMSAWTQTWQSLIEKRGGPAAGMMMGATGNPAAWPQSVAPLLEEIRRGLALPRFADLPGVSEDLLPSPTASVDVMLLLQQYLAAVMPAWAKACENFQKEIAERNAKGDKFDVVTDGLDVWNRVLDRTLMEFNRSDEFAGIQQRMLRVAMQQKQETRRRAEMVAEAMDMPTRTEMNDVYARLHSLMREVHGLRREVRALKAQARGSSSTDSGHGGHNEARNS